MKRNTNKFKAWYSYKYDYLIEHYNNDYSGNELGFTFEDYTDSMYSKYVRGVNDYFFVGE